MSIEDDIAFREGCIEACEAILHCDININSTLLTENHIRERLTEYRASLAEVQRMRAQSESEA